MEWVTPPDSRDRRERIAVRFDELLGVPAPLVVLYLHGFGSRQEGEKATFFRARALESGLAFCSFDFRGHGASQGSMRELTLTRNLADVAAVGQWLAEKGHSRIALFGSSMGGATALWHAALRPRGVAAVALIAPAVGMAVGMERWAGPERLARWEREGSIPFSNEFVACELGWGLMEDLRRYPLDDLVARYRTPTVIFQGKLDDTVEWRDVAAFAGRVAPGIVDLRLFDDGGHRLTERMGELWEGASALFRRTWPPDQRLGAGAVR
jgi:pimeloyl-ACP methyl ester carboxylesterase